METASEAYARLLPLGEDPGAAPLFSDVQKMMLDATPDCIKVLSPKGKLLTMNRAGCVALGVAEGSGFGMDWLPLLPPDVHPLGLKALHDAAMGRTARFPGRSVFPQGTIYWDNLLTPLVDQAGEVLSILCVSRDVTAQTLLEQEREKAIERQKLVAAEMRHRIKNLFSVVAGLMVIAEKEANVKGDQAALAMIFRDKLAALARASEAVFSSTDDGGQAGKGPELESVLRSVLEPYGARCQLSGDKGYLRPEMMTILALFLHELATNSVKHGALSTDAGRVVIAHIIDGSDLRLLWTEKGGPLISAPPARSGFGTEMVDRLVRSVGGDVSRSWLPTGLVVSLNLPSALHSTTDDGP
ncbi:PAS domain-containing protein [Rhizobium lusitanum]|uniref:histidine kinase n=1 Tax=Rhizobium lusitanum TaxID=293958 RepID=A0A6L9UM01_9HYPH|nr:PAS domain-containing protein [Rhizobium lusitanum]NEI74870.1 PAS domain-containing protein [Rhizobium lusitanum]